MDNQQLHKRLTNEQVKKILENYLIGEISSLEAGNKLEIEKTRFFELVKKEFKKKKKEQIETLMKFIDAKLNHKETRSRRSKITINQLSIMFHSLNRYFYTSSSSST